MSVTPVCICFLHLASYAVLTVGNLFDPNYVGVYFSPYYELPGPIYEWSFRQVERQLEVVSTRFQYILTNAAGVYSLTDTWDKGDPDGKVAFAASNINKKLKRLHLTVNVGIRTKNRNEMIGLRAITNAFEAVAAANKNYPGTAVGVNLIHYDIKDDQTLRKVIKLLEICSDLKTRANGTLKLMLVSDFHDYLDRLSANLTRRVFDLVDTIAITENCDYTLQSSDSVELTTEYFLKMATRLLQLKNDVDLVGLAICASSRSCTSDNDIPVDDLLTEYWIGVANWAAKAKFRVNFFSALDIPGRGEKKNCTRISHSGWWTYFPGNDSFVEKYKNKTTLRSGEAEKHSIQNVGWGITAAMIILIFMVALRILYQKFTNLKRVRSDQHIILEDTQYPENERTQISKNNISIQDTLEDTENGWIDEPKCSNDIPAKKRQNKKVWRSKQPLWINSPDLKALGSGYFAQVFLAISTSTGNTVAIKRIDLYKTLSCSNYQDHDGDSHGNVRLNKLLRETENLSKVNNENVIKLHRWWIEDPSGNSIGVQKLQNSLSDFSSQLSSGENYFMFLQLEYCYGTMSAWIGRFTTVEERQRDEPFIKMFLQVVSGLEAIHSCDIIHRDLKPDNIMYSLNGGTKTWKIGDFGLSKKLEGTTEMNQFTSTAGAPNYKSPEMAKAQRYGTKTDVFSLGLTFLEVLHPFSKFLKKQECFDNLRDVSRGKGAFARIKFELNGSNQRLIKLVQNMVKIKQEERWGILQATKYLQDLTASQRN